MHRWSAYRKNFPGRTTVTGTTGIRDTDSVNPTGVHDT